MGWFPIPWSLIYGLFIFLFIGGVLCLFVMPVLLPFYVILAMVIAFLVIAFVIFVQFLPIFLLLLFVAVLLYMFAVRQGWISPGLPGRVVRGLGGRR